MFAVNGSSKIFAGSAFRIGETVNATLEEIIATFEIPPMSVYEAFENACDNTVLTFVRPKTDVLPGKFQSTELIVVFAGSTSEMISE